ncbi:MAG TPA: ATP-binding protein, partial [Verrucomicrobiae bacterium]|nr:ATP-binding protein [Verrucomicrobiae bacterium]
MREPIKVLLVEDNNNDAELLKRMLSQAQATDREQETNFIPPFYLQRVNTAAEGVERLKSADVDLVLLDLSLPDSSGLDTFMRIHGQAPKLPVIVLSGETNEEIAIQTMRAGAQDYLAKGRVDAPLLARAMRHAVERKRAEETIRRAKEEAEHASNAKGQFLSRMSHELRTPLNAILGFAQVLESNPALPDRESVDQILKGGRHLLDLINEVLEFSRIESGRLEISLAPVPVGEVVREVMDLIRPLAISHKVRLMGDTAISSSHYVFANRQRLKQVLLNLLANAVKYNRFDGTVTISCEPSLRPVDPRDLNRKPSSGALRISIIDTGIGIPPDKMDKLFIPFERICGDDSEVEGTGLGLAVSKGLVEAMHGVIGVESDSGKGSIFWIEL